MLVSRHDKHNVLYLCAQNRFRGVVRCVCVCVCVCAGVHIRACLCIRACKHQNWTRDSGLKHSRK
jgi:hypothetical protein